MRLTVVQAIPALNSGGVERCTVEAAEALVRAGHRSVVVSEGGRLVEALVAAGSEHIPMSIGRKSPLTLRMVPKLRRLLASEGVDVLHAQSRLPAWISYLAWRGMPANRRPRFLTTMHGAHSVNRYSRIMTRGERVIAVSDFIRRYILEHFPDVPEERIRVIPGGVDPAEFPYGYRPSEAWTAQWRSAHPELTGRTLVTLPGRLSRRKGHVDFIEVLRRVRLRRPDVHGLVVGGGHERRRGLLEELRRDAGRAGIEAHLTFTGHREDVREIMASSSAVMVLSRLPEAFPRVGLEALSLGVPLVAYDHGGTTEMLRAVYPAGRVPPGDPAAAAARLLELLDTPVPVPDRQPFLLSRTLSEQLSCYEEIAAASVE